MPQDQAEVIRRGAEAPRLDDADEICDKVLAAVVTRNVFVFLVVWQLARRLRPARPMTLIQPTSSWPSVASLARGQPAG